MIKNAKSPRSHSPIGRMLLAPAVALLALGAFAAPASAKPFQQYLNGSCVGPTICQINFAKVPAGQRLEVTSTSCYLRLHNTPTLGPTIFAMQLLVVGANPNNVLNAVTLQPFYIANPGDEDVYSATHTIFAFANAQQRFQAYVEIKSGTFSQFACHISGDMAKAT